MDFVFSDEQQMIRDTAEAFLAQVSTSEAVRQAMASEHGYDRGLWQRICTEMYWQAIHIPEQYGGMGLGYVELVAMAEQMGRYLLCSPFYATVCLAINAVLLGGSEEQKEQALAAICEGSLTATLAYAGSRDTTGASGVSCKRDGDQYVLNGEYHFVVDGHSADLLIAAASDDKGELRLFLLPAETSGVQRTWTPTLDQTRKFARVTLTDVSLPASAALEEGGEQVLSKTLDLAAIALSAEQMGGSQQVLDMSVEYSKERVQFNRPIASFQAIKHKAADMMLRVEAARSAVYYAACVADEALAGADLAAELPEAASIAKAYCSEAFFKNAGEALQIHGGVGFTWEYDVHLYFKRAKASEFFLGSADYHRERIAQLILD